MKEDIFEDVFKPMMDEGNYYDAVALLIAIHKRTNTVYSEDLHTTVKELATTKAASVRAVALSEGKDDDEAFVLGLDALYEIYDLLRNERGDL